MKRSSDSQILTTTVGSLPRLDEVNEMHTDLVNHRPVDQDAFDAAIAKGVDKVVQRQVDAGISVVSDGEMSKWHFSNYFNTRVTGYTKDVDLLGAIRLSALESMPEIVQAVWGPAQFGMRECTEPITYTDKGRRELERDIANLTGAVQRSGAIEGFMTAPSPGVVALLNKNTYYPTVQEYAFALAEALHEEYTAITDAGLVLQIDAPEIACVDELETWMWGELEARGRRGLQDLYIEAINIALDGIDPEMVRLHLCWVNYMGPHNHDLPLEDVLVPSWAANVAAYSFEAANPAHNHEWAVFETLEVPDGKLIIPGIIDSKTQVVENPKLVAERIDRYVKLVGAEKFIAGSDCGFGTAVGLGTVHPEVTWLKLESLGAGAVRAAESLASTHA